MHIITVKGELIRAVQIIPVKREPAVSAAWQFLPQNDVGEAVADGCFNPSFKEGAGGWEVGSSQI